VAERRVVVPVDRIRGRWGFMGVELWASLLRLSTGILTSAAEQAPF
jgi:hypothetical protein